MIRVNLWAIPGLMLSCFMLGWIWGRRRLTRKKLPPDFLRPPAAVRNYRVGPDLARRDG